MIEYEFWLYSPQGQLTAVLDRFLTANIQRSVNRVGSLSLSLPWGAYPTSLFQDNSIILPWRSADGGPLKLVGQTWFSLQKSDKGLSSSGLKTLDLTCYDPIFFLGAHDIDYAAGSAYADKTGAADDIMKAYVRENMGALATDAARNMEPWILAVTNLGAGPSTSKSASHRDLLTTLQEIASDSFTKGTYLAFDITAADPSSSIYLKFRTYTGARGVDHSWTTGTNPVILDPENGNLAECVRTIDNTNTGNAITAGGQGEGASRVMATAADASVSQSIWNRRELFVDARNGETAASVQAEADAALKANRKRTTFAAKFVPTPGIQFMREFDFGDIVTCVWDDESYDMRTDTFGLKFADGQETPDIAWRSDV